MPASAVRVTILPFPKGFSRGTILGFCDGHAVGRVENARAKTAACWWPEGKPELLALEGQKDIRAARASGLAIPGCWSHSRTGALGAVAWRRKNSTLVLEILHDKRFVSTWAHGAGGRAVVGMGTPDGKLGRRGPDVGLVWRDDAEVETVTADRDVALFCTDGTSVAGSVGGRPAFWPSTHDAAVDLSPEGMGMGEVQAIDGDRQFGAAFKGLCARAAMWRGSASSFVDLTPDGFEAARIFGAASGRQAGLVRRKDTTRNGSSACDDRAVLWNGSARDWIDLNAALPAAYNASVAWAIEMVNGVFRIGGEARRVDTSDAGTPRESHAVPVAHPVIWEL